MAIRITSIIAIALSAIVFLCTGITNLHAAKTDLVVLINGNEILGEIKQLNRGKLEYSTDHMGTIYIKWDRIVRISSADSFEIELSNGQKFFGRILPTDEDRRMIVSGVGARGYLDMDWVIHIVPLKASFLAALKGYVDLGFSYVKTSDDATLTLKSKLDYRTAKYLMTLDLSSYYNLRRKELETTRNSIGLSFSRYFSARYFGRANTSFEQNSELNLDLRILIGAGAGRYLVQTNNKLFFGYLGLVANMEYFSTAEKRTDNLEGVIAAGYEWFTFDFPELDFVTTLYAYPSLTGNQRWRLDFEARISYEIIKDFTIGLNLYDNYDSAPAGGGGETNDWGATLSLGLKIK